jgi:uncharacterized protein
MTPKAAPPFYLPPSLPAPVPGRDGLDGPYWAALREERLIAQRCSRCRTWQWGPEWLCHNCHAFEVEWSEVPHIDGRYEGDVFSFERVWPTDAIPRSYLVGLVELPQAGGIRMVGALPADMQRRVIGTRVCAVFDHHPDYTLVHWQPLRKAPSGPRALAQ